MDLPCSGIDLRRLLQVFRRLGGHVETVRGTGEIRLHHRLMSRTVRANGRRKSAPRHLTAHFGHRDHSDRSIVISEIGGS